MKNPWSLRQYFHTLSHPLICMRRRETANDATPWISIRPTKWCGVQARVFSGIPNDGQAGRRINGWGEKEDSSNIVSVRVEQKLTRERKNHGTKRHLGGYTPYGKVSLFTKPNQPPNPPYREEQRKLELKSCRFESKGSDSIREWEKEFVHFWLLCSFSWLIWYAQCIRWEKAYG